MADGVSFTRLPTVRLSDIVDQMNDPRVAEHMPLLTSKWDMDITQQFVAKKEEFWRRDGLGHWAILADGEYVGWGGFQREGGEWDYGLVLKPDAFGLGKRISRKAIAFAVADERIPYITFLLPPSRRNLGALDRLGADCLGQVDHDGAVFVKYRLVTA